MKNRKQCSVVRIVAIFAVIVTTLALAACVQPTSGPQPSSFENGGAREEAINLPSTSGEFTFTDIPSKYNGKYALLEGVDFTPLGTHG